MTKVEKLEQVRASHCKPWRDSNNEGRLNSENGLLFTPSIDHLFDRGFISFEDAVRLIISRGGCRIAKTHKDRNRTAG